ncbi:uncharacterized protein FOMMEDRAFT_158255 [Fomitiporia mediterranea MF3/22]|uniref:uncharacterized protein n=1 Tax=Fomitiporia mediterranea (strain MF3/22) TaxID=694068 RepID=UPI00044095DE|nr:uncharacterized protein FOMMEDRAFT_158255 [Fomitiporia mediterranea MF3/22]EJD01122.1 hypothetical protein FOMMEDRAFT_158255 [Fomitiporia mediterranea MF3/22]
MALHPKSSTLSDASQTLHEFEMNDLRDAVSRGPSGSGLFTHDFGEVRPMEGRRRRASYIADAIESPDHERDQFEDAESLVDVSQPPRKEEVEEGAWPPPEHQELQDYYKSYRTRTRANTGRRFSQLVDALESPTQERGRFEDAESLFNIPQPPDEAEVAEGAATSPDQSEKPKVYPPLAYPVITSLIPGSIFGVLARLGILAITGYDQHSIFPLAWVQGTGCLIMGFALGLRDQIGAYYGPLYTAIATGFCGSLTTFSSWQLDVFLSWANSGHARRDWFRDVIDGFTKTVFTLAISLSALTLGIHLSRPIQKRFPRVKQASVAMRYVFRIVSVLMYIATIPVYFKAPAAWRHQVTAALLFSFPGTLTRYLLATSLTPLLHLFPLGTFVANVSGTALIGVFHVLMRTPHLPSPNACAILQGLMDGYCGCLTTISTFAVEVGALRTKRAWLYVLLSWGASQILLLVILGSAWWGGNIDDNRVCTFA